MTAPGSVLDASAVLAAVLDEVEANQSSAWFEQAAISAANMCEVITKLLDLGFEPAWIDWTLERLNLDVQSFDESQARAAAHLRTATRRKGLSLGDRACLALAQKLACGVITADRAWADLDLGIPIRIIR